MRDRQTPLTNELQEYLFEHFSAEDEFLNAIANKCWDEAGIPQINITSYQANFLQFLVKSISAKNILEIGTLAGYSAIVLARAAGDDAKIITVEKEAKHAEFAQKKILEAGLQDNIKVITQNAREFIKSFSPENKLDFIFIDADKSSYYKYLNALTPYLREGGLFVFDNAFAFGFLLETAPERNPAEVRSMLAFHQYLLSRKDYFTTLVPIGDGLLVSLRKPILRTE